MCMCVYVCVYVNTACAWSRRRCHDVHPVCMRRVGLDPQANRQMREHLPEQEKQQPVWGDPTAKCVGWCTSLVVSFASVCC